MGLSEILQEGEFDLAPADAACPILIPQAKNVRGGKAGTPYLRRR
jgi:hypothetical protein